MHYTWKCIFRFCSCYQLIQILILQSISIRNLSHIILIRYITNMFGLHGVNPVSKPPLVIFGDRNNLDLKFGFTVVVVLIFI